MTLSLIEIVWPESQYTCEYRSPDVEEDSSAAAATRVPVPLAQRLGLGEIDKGSHFKAQHFFCLKTNHFQIFMFPTDLSYHFNF